MFSVPEGEIAVYGADGPDDLVALPKDRITVSQRMKPSADALAEAGFRVGDPSRGPGLVGCVHSEIQGAGAGMGG